MNEKTKEFFTLLSELRSNYTHGVFTTGECCNDGCNTAARGGGNCPRCLTMAIGELISDNELAKQIHLKTREVHRVVGKALDKMK